MGQPLETPVVGDATLGWTFACSRRGSSHGRTGKPCQDAYAVWSGSAAGAPCLAMAVADGHGDDRHDLSHFGSALAVRAAIEELIALSNCYALERKWAQLKASFKTDFPRRLARRWREAVLTDYRQRAEVAGDPLDSDAEGALLIRHGTTLIVALLAGDVLLLGQIGDGDVVLVKDGGDVECPLGDKPLVVGGETESLSSAESPRLWRTTALEQTGGLLLLATDGLRNAFADDDQWYAFARSLCHRIHEFGVLPVASALPSWLDHYSEKASGDDITLAVAVVNPSPGADDEGGEPKAVEGSDSPRSRIVDRNVGPVASGTRLDAGAADSASQASEAEAVADP